MLRAARQPATPAPVAPSPPTADPFDPASLRLDANHAAWLGVKKAGQTGCLSLRGPIPLDWLARAHEAGGSALAVGLSLWFIREVSGKPGPVKVGSFTRSRFGLTKDQTRGGLRSLEEAGLVAYVKRGRGRCAVVEIVDRRLVDGKVSVRSLGGVAVG